MGGESVSSLHAPCVFIFPTPLNPIFRPTPAHVKCYVAPSIYRLIQYSTVQYLVYGWIQFNIDFAHRLSIIFEPRLR